MLSIAYRFHALPRHQDHFRHAYQAARETLQQALGLVSHELNDPRGRRDPFILQLSWDNQASFDRFTHSWIGVWMINGMGLSRHDFFAPIDAPFDASQPTRHTDGSPS
ncbi:antibiotic biosynthesis monooxygenase [Thiobacillus sp.]|uniref:antibiotic biosynthesis monooxygenase family protein n=1 Tax=Thiobacillus sp. TaxID=924 RepID=UPI0025E8F305|nr:antibiotic biosynthesis monooxygenase [Thiobacillus sp.]MBT9539944.1 hypothetical protein [Thiobacillus sp.]